MIAFSLLKFWIEFFSKISLENQTSKINKQMETLFGILILSAIILIILYKTFANKSASNYPEIAICGPSGSGKTLLFYKVLSIKLTRRNSPKTVSSIKINQAPASINEKMTTITDIPGHNYFQKDLISKLPRIRGLIMLVDSVDKSSFKKAAEDLYGILSTHNPKRLMIFCNKQDQPFAKKTLMVESELSTEM